MNLEDQLDDIQEKFKEMTEAMDIVKDTFLYMKDSGFVTKEQEKILKQKILDMTVIRAFFWYRVKDKFDNNYVQGDPNIIENYLKQEGLISDFGDITCSR